METLLEELPPGVVLARDAEAGGIGGATLRDAARRGALIRVRSGAYVRATEWEIATPEARHRMAVAAAARQLEAPAFCLESAAVVWGLPVVAHVGRLHVLDPGGRGSGTRGDLTRHGARGSNVVEHGGVRVTAPLDTVLQLAATRDLRSALPVADAALRGGLVSAGELRAAARGRGGARGARRVRLVAALADGGAESPGESVSRARIHLDGFTRPRTQVPLMTGGVVFARVDIWWDRPRVVGEFDGRLKYRVDGVPDRRAVEDRLWAEKRREDRIRAAGIPVVRWTWHEAWHPGPLAALLAAQGVPRRPPGDEPL